MAQVNESGLAYASIEDIIKLDGRFKYARQVMSIHGLSLFLSQ